MMKYFADNQIICTFVHQIKQIKTKSYDTSYRDWETTKIGRAHV